MAALGESLESSSCRYDYLLKAVLVGDSTSGKTSLLKSLLGDEPFKAEYVPTIVIDFQVAVIHLDRNDSHPDKGAQRVKLQVWDPSGQPKYQSLCENFYRGTMGILCCFDMTNRQSFVHVERWIQAVKNQMPEQELAVFIIGCKSDLPSSQREVSKEEAHHLAINNQARYIETSAKNGDNVQRAFSHLAQAILAIAENNALNAQTSDLEFAAEVKQRKKPISMRIRQWGSKRASSIRRPKSLRKSFKFRDDDSRPRKSQVIPEKTKAEKEHMDNNIKALGPKKALPAVFARMKIHNKCVIS